MLDPGNTDPTTACTRQNPMTNRCPQSNNVQCRVASFWVAFGGFALVLVASIVGAVLAFAAVKAQAATNTDVNIRQDRELREVTTLLRDIHANQMVIMHHLDIRPPVAGANGPRPKDRP